MFHSRIRRLRLPGPVLALGVLAGSLVALPVTTTATPAQAAPASGKLFSNPGKALGSHYTDSTDIDVQATGDSGGLHILMAKESDGFTFREIARLGNGELSDVGPWTGYVCTTGSGRYAAAVYAPSAWTNEPGATARGAFAAVIRLSDGKVTEVADGVQLAYFSPGCGDGDRVMFTSSSATDTDIGDTTLIEADAATGQVSSERKIAGQLTHVVPTAHGDYGVLGGKLVTLTGGGKKLKATVKAKVPGPLFALTASANGAVDIGTVQNGKSVVTRWQGGALTRLGSGTEGKVKLFSSKGGDIVAGDVAGIDTAHAPGLVRRAFDGRPTGVSREGHLVTTSVFSEQMKGVTSKLGSPSDEGAGLITVQANAAETDTAATTMVDASQLLPTGADTTGTEPAAITAADASGPDDVDPLTCGDGGPESQCLTSSGADVYGPVLAMEAPCTVERNDPKRQALQPSANMVEWAVDQAVHGDLTTTRPANWHDTGLPAFSPQGLFPKADLTDGDSVPAQVMLGILAQESNFKQASWHSIYGDSGNVLQADWFGNGASIHYYPDRSKADCGYGIGQVTTGMSEAKPDPYDTLHAGAIATDYASNISAGLRILTEKWNQLKALGMNVNNGDSKYIENWYMALWGYNSGVYTDSSEKTGLGFLNNPANAVYPADRAAFLRFDYGDASHPADWPYQEKVLGWAEVPQQTWNAEPSYSKPNMPVANVMLNTPTSYGLFCDPSVNACTPGAADPCPTLDQQCRWNQSVTWVTGQQDGNSSTENLAYSLGSGEPALESKYDHGPCIDYPNGDETALIVDDLGEHENTYGCDDIVGATDGKFTLQTGDNITMQRDDTTWRATPYIAQIDIHQLGAGYDNHIYFTHSYPAGDIFHKVTGRWELNQARLPAGDQPGKRYDVFAHLPSHGGQANVKYNFIPGDNTVGAEADYCHVNQATRSNGSDTWFEFGTFTFWKGGRIEADNLHDPGTGDADVAFDAIAFVPHNSKVTTQACKLIDSGP
ncbi:hypothetical protein [Streptomyces sp. NPDC047000]|uniref:hypothetical protein n=1 Tax=Streptomyces sp. NPDC047000 TaxID=3155474 RepID=UPI003410226E